MAGDLITLVVRGFEIGCAAANEKMAVPRGDVYVPGEKILASGEPGIVPAQVGYFFFELFGDVGHQSTAQFTKGFIIRS